MAPANSATAENNPRDTMVRAIFSSMLGGAMVGGPVGRGALKVPTIARRETSLLNRLRSPMATSVAINGSVEGEGVLPELYPAKYMAVPVAVPDLQALRFVPV